MADAADDHDATLAGLDIPNVRWQGVFAFSELKEELDFYPYDGYGGTGSIQDQIYEQGSQMNLNCTQLSEEERLQEVWLKFLPNGIDYKHLIFCRVEVGKFTSNQPTFFALSDFTNQIYEQFLRIFFFKDVSPSSRRPYSPS